MPTAIYDRFAPPLVDDAAAALLRIDPLADRRQSRRWPRNFSCVIGVTDEANRESLMRLFEMERAAQAALTSCAWFFDDFGGPEGRVVLRWAARAVELAAEFALSVEPELLERLREIRFQPARDRRRRHAIPEPQDTRSTREGMIAMADDATTTISNRSCAKAASFRRRPSSAAQAHVKSLAEYEALYRRAEEDPEAFWAECASELHWFKPFDKVLEWKFPFAKWFVGGKLNASYNCLDRHLTTARRNKAALIWEGEPGDTRVLTYQMLAERGRRAAPTCSRAWA